MLRVTTDLKEAFTNTLYLNKMELLINVCLAAMDVRLNEARKNFTSIRIVGDDVFDHNNGYLKRDIKAFSWDTINAMSGALYPDITDDEKKAIQELILQEVKNEILLQSLQNLRSGISTVPTFCSTVGLSYIEISEDLLDEVERSFALTPEASQLVEQLRQKLPKQVLAIA